MLSGSLSLRFVTAWWLALSRRYALCPDLGAETDGGRSSAAAADVHMHPSLALRRQDAWVGGVQGSVLSSV